MELRLKQPVSLLGIINAKYSEIEDSFKAMARVQVAKNRLDEYLKLVFPEPDPAKIPAARYERASRQVQEQREWAECFFDQGKGNQIRGVKGTLWAAYNGVTEFIDHRDIKFSADRHLQYMWFGRGYSIKSWAFNAAIGRVNEWKN